MHVGCVQYQANSRLAMKACSQAAKVLQAYRLHGSSILVAQQACLVPLYWHLSGLGPALIGKKGQQHVPWQL